MSNDFVGAERAYRAVLDSDSDVTHRREAAVTLAGALSLDARAILTGLRSYYLVDAGDTLNELLAAPQRMLRELVLSGDDSPDAMRAAASAATPATRTLTTRGRAALVHALAQSRFFQAAAAVALLPDSTGAPLAAQDARARAAVAYADFLRAVNGATDDYYRRAALGAGSKSSWMTELDSAARRLWTGLGESGQAPRFADAQLREAAASLDPLARGEEG